MFKLPFFKAEEKIIEFEPNTNYLAMDIGTEVLKSILFSASDEGVMIKKVSRLQQQQNAMNKGIITNLSTVLENCRLSIRELTVGLQETEYPRKIVLGIAGEFIQGVSIIVNYERDEKYDEEVTLAEQKKIVNKVFEQITENGKSDLARRTGLSEEDIEILHITVTGMEIGGMTVDTLVGFKGKDVKLFFYASFAPKTFIDSLKKLTQSLEMDLIGIVSQPFAVARAFGNSQSKDFSGIFVDIGGGTTDVAVVVKGNIIDTQMFGFGGRVFTKEISRLMNMDYRHAEARKIKYTEGQLDGKIHSETKTICYNVAKIWIKNLSAALEMCEDVESFPTQILLCGGGSLLPDIKNVLLEFPWTRLFPFSSIPKIAIITPDKLDKVRDPSKVLRFTYDVTPASLAKFAYDKIKNPNNYYNEIK